MKYLELMFLDGNRETSELTDGQVCKYEQQNYEMLKDREERSTMTAKQGGDINTNNTICTVTSADISVTHTFGMLGTNQNK